MMELWTSAPVPVLAFLTTIHVAVVALRHHRSAASRNGYLLVIPATAFAATPWLFPSAVGLAVGLGAQVAWFVACEKLARPPGRSALGPVPAAASTAPARAASLARSRDDRGFQAVPVLAVHSETPTIRTFRLARPPHFTFAAGQFLTVRVEIDGRPLVRCYSISSAPEMTGYLEISVRRQGLVSSALHDLARPGSVLHVKPPAGRFVYPANDSRPIVLLAGGIGITPLLSMLRHAVNTEPSRPVTLLYSVRSSPEMAFADELEVLARRHPQVSVALTVSEPTEPCPRTGHIDLALLRETVAFPGGALHYICGPTPMMDAMRALLSGLEVPDAQVRTEVFEAAAAIGAAAAAPDAARLAPEVTDELREHRMTCSVARRVVAVPSGVSLLEAAEAGGVEVPSMCRAGVCGTCRSRLTAGNVRCTSDALDEDDRKQGFVLPCVTWAEGDCVLEV